MKRRIAMFAKKRRLAIGMVASTLAVMLLGSFLIGPAFAQSATPTTDTGSDSQSTTENIYQQFIDKLTANLGLSDSTTVDTAVKTTLKQIVDQAQTDGHLSEAQANALKERIDQGDFPGNFARIYGGRFSGKNAPLERRGRNSHHGGAQQLPPQATLIDGLDKFAGFLGETPADLRAELKQGMSLTEIAAAHGKTQDELRAFLVEQAEARIDAMLNSGSGESAPNESAPSASATPNM